MNLVTIPGITNEALTQHLVNVCEDRGDALAIIDPKGDTTRQQREREPNKIELALLTLTML